MSKGNTFFVPIDDLKAEQWGSLTSAITRLAKKLNPDAKVRITVCDSGSKKEFCKKQGRIVDVGQREVLKMEIL